MHDKSDLRTSASSGSLLVEIGFMRLGGNYQPATQGSNWSVAILWVANGCNVSG